MHYFGDFGYQFDQNLVCPIGANAGSQKYELNCECDLSYDIYYIKWLYGKERAFYQTNPHHFLTMNYLNDIGRDYHNFSPGLV